MDTARESGSPGAGRGGATARGLLQPAAFLVVVVAGLKLGADLLVPLLTAAFLATLCVPVVNALRRRGLSTTPAILLTLVVVLAVVLGTTALLVDSLSDFAARVPAYREQVETTWQNVRAWLEAHGLRLAPPHERPPLEPGDLLQTVGRAAGTAMSALTTVFLVLLLTVFMIFEGVGLPSKLRRFLGRADADLEGPRRVLREVYVYLGVKTLVGLATGVLFGLWCLLLGVDSWFLWGFLAFALNYIPNIGSLLAAIPPILVALLQLGLGPAALVLGGNLVVNQVFGSVVEPRLMGARLGLSPLVVFLSLVFWSWLWGPIGMLLSVPLTMVVNILLESSDAWRPLAALLGPAGEPDPVER